MEVLLDYELIKLLWDYKKRQALADDEFVKKAIITILDKRNALDQVSKINAGSNAYLFDIPFYDKEEQAIYFRTNLAVNHVVERFFTNKEDIVTLYNLKVLTNVIKVCNSITLPMSKQNFESYLLNLEMNFKTAKTSPLERMTTIDALKKIWAIAGWVHLDDADIVKDYYYYETTKAMLKDYYIDKDGSLICPAYTFLSKYIDQVKPQDKTDKIFLLDDLNIKALGNTLDKNLYCGLPISVSEYKKLKSNKDKASFNLLRKRS